VKKINAVEKEQTQTVRATVDIRVQEVMERLEFVAFNGKRV